MNRKTEIRMSKLHIGQCRICGMNTKLTFEHIPPRTSFNKHTVRTFKGGDLTKVVKGKSIQSKINQKGSGDYYLCAKCNNNTGDWYVPGYDRIVKGLGMSVLKYPEIKPGMTIFSKMTDVNPLAFAKELISIMCCSISIETVKELEFDKLLEDRHSNDIDITKFDLRIYLTDPNMSHYQSSETVLFKMDKNNVPFVEHLSEVTTFPLGIILNLNPEQPIEYGISVNEMLTKPYEDFDMSITIPFYSSPYNGAYHLVMNSIEKTGSK